MANFVVLHEIGTKKGVFLKSCGSFLGFLISGRMQVRIHARFGAILPAEPDRPVPLQIADHDAVGVPLADRDLVDADRAWRWRPCSSELLLHVLLVEFLDGAPIQVQLAGDVLDRRGPTAPAHKERKALGVEGVVGEPRQLLLLHFAATPAAAPDGARSPDRFWCLPPRGLVPGAACDRRFGARADRRPHTEFFSPPLKSYDADLGIPEHPSYCRPRTKCGEAVHIHQPPRSPHRQFMPSFRTSENSARPCSRGLSTARS